MHQNFQNLLLIMVTLGAEFMTAIPGTVGGLLSMNAGCYGTEIWEIVKVFKQWIFKEIYILEQLMIIILVIDRNSQA